MKTILFLCVLSGVLNARSADLLKVLECHDKTVRQGIDSLTLPKQVESLFGATNVDHFISEFNRKGEPPTWHSVAYFGGKYTFSLSLPIKIDYEKCEVLGPVNSAQIQINEVTHVEISTSGIAGAKMNGQWRLNENEFKWLLKNQGDWAAVKIPIRTNAPVKGFDEYVRQIREPIRNRRGGFDNVIRKAREESEKEPGKGQK